MRERVAWWWNNRWGHLARRDVKIFRDGEIWSVEYVRGGVEGRTQDFEDLDEAQARATARELMASAGDWRDMMPN